MWPNGTASNTTRPHTVASGTYVDATVACYQGNRQPRGRLQATLVNLVTAGHPCSGHTSQQTGYRFPGILPVALCRSLAGKTKLYRPLQP